MKENGNLREIGLKKVTALLIGAVAAAVATILLIAVFAFIMLKAELSASAENIGIICISVISCFAGGSFAAGEMRREGFSGDWLWDVCTFCFCYCYGREAGSRSLHRCFLCLQPFFIAPGAECLAGCSAEKTLPYKNVCVILHKGVSSVTSASALRFRGDVRMDNIRGSSPGRRWFRRERNGVSDYIED